MALASTTSSPGINQTRKHWEEEGGGEGEGWEQRMRMHCEGSEETAGALDIKA